MQKKQNYTFKTRTVFSAFLIGTLIIGAAVLVPKPALAATGSQLIGISAANRGMGGIGVGGGTSLAESFYKNPAVLSSVRIKDGGYDTELNLTYVGLDTTASLGGPAASQSGNNLVPSLAAGYAMGDITLGLAVFGFSGVDIDFTSNGLLNGIGCKYRASRIALGGSYKINPRVSVGIEPFMTYSDLSVTTAVPQNSRGPHGAVGFGVQVGAVANIAQDLTGGLNFTSSSRVTHPQITDLDAFGGAGDGILDPFTISTPMDFSLGFNYKGIANLELGLDYHYIDFAHAAGYSDFGWNASHVIALGAGYRLSDWAFRAGFNYSSAPIANATGESGTVVAQGHTILKNAQSSLNMVAFPAFTQANITVGTGYNFSEDLGVDASFLYAPQVTRTHSGNLIPALGGTAYTYTGSTSQWALSLGARYRI